MSRAARDEDDAAIDRARRAERIAVDTTVDLLEAVVRDLAERLADRLGGDVEVRLTVRRR